jgi:hypothetical protein
MNPIAALISTWTSRSQPRASCPEARTDEADTVWMNSFAGDEPPRACGWFDSSHELQQGLWVEEDLPLEVLAQALAPAGGFESGRPRALSAALA